MSQSKYRVAYTVYNNDDFYNECFTDTKEDAERIALGLQKLKHVTKVVVTPDYPNSRKNHK